MQYTTVTPESEEAWRKFVEAAAEVFDTTDLVIEYDEFVTHLPVIIEFQALHLEPSRPDDIVSVSLTTAALDEYRERYGYRNVGWKPQSDWK